MITTARSILTEVSSILGETPVNVSNIRFDYFNRAVNFYFSKHPFKFRIKSYDLTTTSDKEYDLIAKINDYDPTFGVYLVEDSDGTQLEPIDFSERNSYYGNEPAYYLTPDKKTIGFTSIESGKTYKIYYYAYHLSVSDPDSALNVPIPQTHISAIIHRILFYVYQRRRQRHDARNAMLDFKEELEENISAEGREKRIGNFPRIVNGAKTLLGL